jgi:predicted dehydrogenase
VCIHAAQAGKDIYAEKPMTLTILEGRRMVEAVRKYNRVFQTGSQQRSMKTNIIGCAMVRAGRAGKIKKVVAKNYPSPWPNHLPGQPVPEGLDWDTWCGPVEPVPFNKDLYAPRTKPGWISFREFSGGEMTGWGAHGFDMIQWALGTDDTGPVRIWTEGEPMKEPILKEPHGRGAGESQTNHPTVFMEYANGAVMELGKGPDGGGLFYGDKGMIGIDRGKLWSDPKDLTAEPLKEDELPTYGDGENDHFRNFFDCVKTRKRPIADVEIGHRSSTICHLGNIARWVGHELKWDPKAETFIGDDEANKLIDRPRRKGYELPDKV